MASVMELVADLEELCCSRVTAARSEQRRRRNTELARRLSGILKGADLDVETSHAAALALKDVPGAGTEFVELAQRLARASWKGGHPEGARLYASVTDMLCNRRHEPQRYGTLTYARHGEKILLPVDPTVDDEERAELGCRGCQIFVPRLRCTTVAWPSARPSSQAFLATPPLGGCGATTIR